MRIKLDPVALSGILLTGLSYALFSVHDAAIKWIVVSYPVLQILFIRSVIIVLGCLALGGRDIVAKAVRSPARVPLLSRSLLLLAAWLSFYTAARSLPLAELTTLYYAAPIGVTLLSVPVLKEVVTPPRWIALGLGFTGVLIACNPTGIGLTWPVYLALQAAALWAVCIVLLRKTALQETTQVSMLITNTVFIILTGGFAYQYWVAPTGTEWMFLISTGVLAGLAQFTLFEGMRRADVSLLAPFEYSSLIWSFLLGYLIWGDVPRAGVFVGAALIFSAGFVVLFGEASGNGKRRLTP